MVESKKHFSQTSFCRMSLQALLILIWSVYCLSLPAEENRQESLLDLSLKELMHVNIRETEPKDIYWSSVASPSQNSINLGMLVPVTMEKKGALELISTAEFAITEINAAGGVLGRPLALVIADDSFQTDRRLASVIKLISEYKIKALLGPLTSQGTIELSEALLPDNELLIFPPAANADAISELKDGDQVFRLAATNHQITHSMLDFIENQEFKKVAVFYQRDVFGEEIYLELLNKLEQRIVLSESLSKSVNFETFSLAFEIKRAQKLKAEVLVLVLAPEQLSKVIQQIQTYWQDQLPIILLPEHAMTTAQTNLSAREICVFSVVSKIAGDSPQQLNGFGKSLPIQSATYTAAFVYDTVYLVAAAATYQEVYRKPMSSSLRAVTAPGKPLLLPNPHSLSESIRQNQLLSFIGISGPISFNAKGDNLAVQLEVMTFHQLYGKGCHISLR